MSRSVVCMRWVDPSRRPLDDVERSLMASAQAIQQTTSADRDRLVGLLHQAWAALSTAAAEVAWPVGGTAPAALAVWLHDLRSPVTAIMGWAQMLGLPGDPAIHARAVEAIDRNTKLLRELLGNPPVGPGGVDGRKPEAA